MVPRPPACQGCTQECTLFISLVAGGKVTPFACCQGCPTVQQPAGGGVLPDGKPPVRVAVLDQGTFYADWGDTDAEVLW